MPPRYAYWTILIDTKPTAFRAREKEELLPTFQQLRRTNKDVVMKWFARGRLWESRDEERNSWQRRKTPVGVTPERRGAKASASWVPRDQEKEKRGGDWRPGGQHKDPRNRFKKRARLRDDRQKPAGVAQVVSPAHKPRESRPWTNEPKGAPGGPRPWRDKPSGGAPRGDRRWSNKPAGKARGEFRPRNDAPRPPNFATERRNSEAPPKPATDARPAPSPQSAQTVKKPEPPERGRPRPARASEPASGRAPASGSLEPEAPGVGPRRPEGCGAPRASEK